MEMVRFATQQTLEIAQSAFRASLLLLFCDLFHNFNNNNNLKANKGLAWKELRTVDK